MRRTHRRAAPFFLVLFLSASACTPAGAHHPPTSVTVATLPGGGHIDPAGTVTVGVASLPRNFNPSTPVGDNPVTDMVMEQVWPQPFVTDPSFNTDTSALLESAEVQGLSPFTVVYTINPRASWSDGTPVTGADFTYEWHELLTHCALLPDSGIVAGYRDIAAITSTHRGRTVTVVFRRPYSQWQSLFADLVPSHVARRFGWASAFSSFDRQRVLSAGPFEISSFSPGHDLVLSRNPRYWGTPAQVAHIRFLVEPSTARLLSAMDSGAVSVGEVDLSAFAPGTVADGITMPTVTATTLPQRRTGHDLAWAAYATDTLWQLCFNLDGAATRHLALRQAIEHSLDRSEIVADSEELVDPHSPPALGRLTVTGESSNPNVPGTSPILPKAPTLYQPALALAEYRTAGYRLGRGGLLRLRGRVLRVTLVEPKRNWAVDETGLVIQAELRAIGVEVILRKVTASELLDVVLPLGRFELALAPFGVSTDLATMAPIYTDPVEGMLTPSRNAALWATGPTRGHEPGAVESGVVTRDVFGLEDPVITRDLAAALGDLNPPQSIAQVERAEAALWGDVVSIPLFQDTRALVRSTGLDNVSESPTAAGVMWNAEDWAVLRDMSSSCR